MWFGVHSGVQLCELVSRGLTKYGNFNINGKCVEGGGGEVV